MPRNSPLAGYGAGIRKETLLGWVAWYGISDPMVKYDDLKKKVIDLGLDVSALPAPLRAGDSFKRACRYAEQKKLPYGNLFINTMIRSVSQNTETVERHLVVEIVDANGRRLEYEVAAHLILDKFTFTVTWNEDGDSAKPRQRTTKHKADAVSIRTNVESEKGFDPDSWNLRLAESEDAALTINRTDWAKKPKNRAIVNEALDRFQDEYTAATTYLDSQTLRQMVRRQLTLMRAFLLRRNGSVYFVPKDQEPEAIAMCDLLDWIGHGSGFHILPLVDTAKQREMIQAAFEDEVHESAQTMLNTLQEALHKQEPITKAAWLDYMNRKEALQELAGEYSGLIDKEFIKAGTELALLDDTMTELLKGGLIKEGRSRG